MVDISQIKEHAEVLGSDGQHVGTVDNVEGSTIKLTKNDPTASGHHHIIDVDLVASVEGNSVKLNKTAAEVKEHWHSND